MKNAVLTFIIVLIIALSVVMLSACTDPESGKTTDIGSDTVTEIDTVAYEPEAEDYISSYDFSTDKFIHFNGSNAEVNGAVVSEKSITISQEGDYWISGVSDDFNIIINCKGGTIRLILNGVTLQSKSGAPIFIEKAEKVIITLNKDSVNNLLDTENTVLNSDGEPTAVIFSKSNLVINGEGTLHVSSAYNNAIQSKDSLTITGGAITVDSVDDGIIGKDSLYIDGADITITAEGDGMKSTNSDSMDVGVIVIKDGSFSLVCGADAIQAASHAIIYGGTYHIQTGGGSSKSVVDTAKAIKATSSVSIGGGIFTISSADDAVHSNGSVSITNGSIAITSGDDGIHAESNLNISGGNILITKSYEGIEANNITVSGGVIDITSSDDGVNIAGGADSSSVSRPGGWSTMPAASGGTLTISSGTLFVNSSGDGLDSNGSIVMSGGKVIVSGPTADNNGAIDYDGTFTMTGGEILAVGSSGMLQTPISSNVYGMKVTSATSLSGIIRIENSTGNALITYLPPKNYKAIVYFSPSLTKGSYKIYRGGTASGEATAGLYSSDCSISGASLYTTVTISSYITSGGSGMGGGPGRP